MPETPSPTDRQETDPRVYLAAERTLLAWIRTGLAMMGFGFVVARFGLFLRIISPEHDAGASQTGLSHWVGISLILLGVVVNALAGWQYRRTLARLDAGQPLRPRALSMGVVVSAILAVLGLVMTMYMLVVR